MFVFLGSFGATIKIVSHKEASQDLLQPKQLPQRWTRGPGFRKKRNPAKETGVECRRVKRRDRATESKLKIYCGQKPEPEVEGDTKDVLLRRANI